MTYRLTQKEIDELRAEMKAAGEWAKAELKRRREERFQDEHCFIEEKDTVVRTNDSKGESIVRFTYPKK